MITLTLPWPDKEEPTEPTRAPSRWTAADDAFLRANYRGMTCSELARHMGRSVTAVRTRAWRLKVGGEHRWTKVQIAALRELYDNAGANGVLRLTEFAASMERDKANVCRKAKELGLQTNQSRRVVESRKVRIPKYDTDEERAQATSERMKRWYRENEHPRGMKGKQHSTETRKKLSETGKATYLFMSEEERNAIVMKSLKTRRKNAAGCIAPKVRRGNWKSGWREIGGKRHYFRSRWEANYARYLQWLKDNGQIADWAYEPETFWFEKIKRGVRSYLPDFRVWENNGTSCLHEVKGWMDARSRTTLRRMAKYHPEQKIIVIDGEQYRAIRLKVMRLVEGWEDSARDSHA